MISIPEPLPILFRILGLSLVHFFWEGAIIAALLLVALKLLHKSTPNARYAAACVALATMAAAPIINLQLLSASQVGDIPPVSSHGPESSAAVSTATAFSLELAGHENGLQNIWSVSAKWGSDLLPWMAAAWLIGVCFFCTRLLVGWIGVRRVTHQAAANAGEEIERILARLCRRMGISRPVRILESVAAQVPGVIGWMPAVILMPVSVLTQLSTAEIEAILAHELAHVHRWDYLVNLLQTWIEAVLFYHPAVWWASHQIRIEREQCCDDLVVATLNDRITYARALASLAASVPVRMAPALHATDGLLLNRIRRILGVKADLREGPTAPPLAIVSVTAIVFVCCAVQIRAAAVHSSPPAGSAKSFASHRHPAATSSPSESSKGRSPAAGNGSAAPHSTQAVYLSGQVVSAEDNAPVSSAVVALYQGLAVQAVAQTETLHNGSFVLKAPSAGHYRVSISGPGIVPQQQILEVGSVPHGPLKLTAHRAENSPQLQGGAQPITEVTILNDAPPAPAANAGAIAPAPGVNVLAPPVRNSFPLLSGPGNHAATPQANTGAAPQTGKPPVKDSHDAPAQPKPAGARHPAAVHDRTPIINGVFTLLDSNHNTPEHRLTGSTAHFASLTKPLQPIDSGASAGEARSDAPGDAPVIRGHRVASLPAGDASPEIPRTPHPSTFGISIRDGHYVLNSPSNN